MRHLTLPGAVERPGRIDLLVALAIAVPTGSWTLLLLRLAAPAAWVPLLAPAALSGLLALAWRRTAPTATFAAVGAACAVQVAVPGGMSLLPSLLAFPVAVHAYCAHGDRHAPVVALTVGVLGAGAVTAGSATGYGARLQLPAGYLFGFLLAIVLVSGSLGLYRRMQLAYTAELEEGALRAETEREERARLAALDERARIAREMHDLMAHSLSVIVSQARGGRFAARSDPARALEVLCAIEDEGRQVLTDMRGLLGILRNEKGESSFGPQPGLNNLPELLDRVRSSGLPVDWQQDGEPYRLDHTAELAIYRMVQEALTNTLKHAGPVTRSEVRFGWSQEGLEVVVRDDGRGPGASDGAGQGLNGMRQRLAIVSGSLHVGPGPVRGFQLTARLPRRTDGAAERAAT
ncbi:sensor histidine kinase [Streptomyces exfoliatus]|uniref:sensor histidine kinase n=1 Tax=Streptomyces exfoliatus TaxID=1905 RepID=UPI0004651666|nr:sensor histidine kinase [Streptomyces exfoliatus]